MKKDLHAILGVKPSATDKEIRSAYKRLAKKWHPDVNPNNKKAEEKFKEISEAYEILTDPDKRRKWEMGEADFDSFFRGGAGQQGRRSAGGPGSAGYEFGDMGDLDGIFSQIFGGMGGAGTAGARGGGARMRRPSVGADLQYQAMISFEEAVHGTTLKIHLARTTTCPDCRGQGAIRKSAGPGRVVRETCSACGGTGLAQATENIQVRIPPGVEDGGKVKVAGKGEAGEGGGPAGDLYVILGVRPHAYFRREGGDIVLDLPLTIAEAALGTRIEVPTIEGRVTMTIPPGTSSGQKLRLKGRGVPSPSGSARGDQIVIPQIVTPKGLDPKARQLLEELDRLNPVRPREKLGW